MTQREFCALASRLMRHPAVPYHEEGVREEVKIICAEYGLLCEEDKFGNLIARITRKSMARSRPIVFAAHMDHPGFEVVPSKREVRVRFLGGVPDDYFRHGIPLRLMPGATSAKLGKRLGKERIFQVQTSGKLTTRPSFAVWELEDFAIRRGRIHGRACDDLIGVASALAALIDLKRLPAGARNSSRAGGASGFQAMAAISRAEEVGFRGALTLCRSRLMPKDALVVSLETSRELPGVKMGQGVILRVGDRTSIFDSDTMRFLFEVAAELKQADERALRRTSERGSEHTSERGVERTSLNVRESRF